MTDFSRHQFTTIDELHAAVKANHHKQTFRYYLNIELGYYLVNMRIEKVIERMEQATLDFMDLLFEPSK